MTANDATIHTQVRTHFAQVATSPDPSCRSADDEPWGTKHYDSLDDDLPAEAVLASLGCGNPTAVADLQPGDTVLDLGSGGGIDVLLSARRVGPSGHVYGLDMTPEMLDLARRNAEEARATNVEFLEGNIEEVPLPDSSVDVIISNCVVNLAADKHAVFSEMFRVLRPGGHIGLSDVVTDDDLSDDERVASGSYVGCIAGALRITEYEAGLTAAGFTAVRVTVTNSVDDGVHSAIIKAIKPGRPATPGSGPRAGRRGS